MRNFKNILLVSGSGRNCGKTTFACHAIRHLSVKGPVYGLKVTPHFHLMGKSQQLVAEGEGFKIYEENDLHSGKDTGRMFGAGASKVWFLQGTDEHLPQALKYIERLTGTDVPVVCESGSLASACHPGLHILIVGNQADPMKKSYRENLEKADVIVSQSQFSPGHFPYVINAGNKKWTLNKTKHDRSRRSA